jgi:hypothetical protein
VSVPLSPARVARVAELGRAAETVTELRGLLAERDEEIGRQLAENARLSQALADAKALLEHNANVARDREGLVEQAAEALRQWKERR